MDDKVSVLVTVQLEDAHVERLQAVSPRVQMLLHPAHAPGEIPPDIWDEAEVLLTWDTLPDREMAPQLRWVQVLSAGVNHLLERPLLEAKDVILTTTSGIHAVTMAEYALAMMLAFAHNLPAMVAHKTNHEWARDRSALFTPRVLRGATLGIIGYGSIGRELARMARALGMVVLASKRDPMRPNSGSEYVEPGTGDPDGTLCHRLYPSQALKSMVQDCDYIVVLTPRTPETEDLLSADVLAAIKPGAVLINLARGGIVDEDALLDALESGALRGAAFDVFAQEPLPEESPLWDAPNLIISPHVAGMMPDYLDRAVDVFAENLQRYLASQELLNVVDWERGY